MIDRNDCEWITYRFEHLFERVERQILLNDLSTYDCVGVRWYGLGAFKRSRLSGAEIRRKQQWIIKKDDIVYNKLFAWKGAFAVADCEVDGCIVSDKFPTYRADTEIVDISFLRYLFMRDSIANDAQKLSKGAAAISKLTLNPSEFNRLTITLPSLVEQRRIASRLKTLEEKVRETVNLAVQMQLARTSFLRHSISSWSQQNSPQGVLEHVLISDPRNGWSAKAGGSSNDVPILALSAITGFVYRPTEHKFTAEQTFDTAHYWLNPGDVLMTRSNTKELVGNAAIYSGEPFPCIYPDLMMRLDVDPRKVDKRFLIYWLQSDIVRKYIESKAKGTSPTMKKINQPIVKGIPFPTQLSIESQSEAARYFDGLASMLDGAKALDDLSEIDLSALFPAILDRAFKGEL